MPLGDQLLPLRLRVAREAELGVDLVDVLLYAAVREEEPARDLAVGQARGDECRNLPFAPGQPDERRRAAGRAQRGAARLVGRDAVCCPLREITQVRLPRAALQQGAYFFVLLHEKT